MRRCDGGLRRLARQAAFLVPANRENCTRRLAEKAHAAEWAAFFNATPTTPKPTPNFSRRRHISPGHFSFARRIVRAAGEQRFPLLGAATSCCPGRAVGAD